VAKKAPFDKSSIFLSGKRMLKIRDQSFYLEDVGFAFFSGHPDL